MKKVLMKVIMIGDSGVGKTSLLNVYVNRKFTGYYKATIGTDFLSKDMSISNKDVTMQLWDTAGQERFQSLGSSFYRGCDCCIIVFDITSSSSFSSLDFWLETFKSYSKVEKKDFPFLLIGNKSDLEDKRAVSSSIASQWAKNNNMIYVETSAKTYESVEKAIETIVSDYIDKLRHEIIEVPSLSIRVDNSDSPKKNCC